MTSPEVLHTRVPAMAWCRHEGNDDFIYWSPRTTVIGPDVRWPAVQVFQDRRCSNNPTISGSGPGALMAWKGGGGDTRIWFSEWYSAANTWGPQQPTPFETHFSPTLVRYLNHTFIFFRAVPSPTLPGLAMQWAEYAGGGRWHIPLEPQSSFSSYKLGGVFANSVAATWHTQSGALAIAWQVVSGAEAEEFVESEARYQELTDGTWDNDSHTVRGAQVNGPPALTSDGNLLHLAWRDAGDDNISRAYSTSGLWLGHQKLDDRATSAGPALAAINISDLVMVWKGVDGDSHMWWSRMRNNVWGPQQPFTDSQHQLHAPDGRVAMF